MNRCLLITLFSLFTLVGTTQGATISSIEDVALLAGSPLHIALDGGDANGGPLTFSATSDDPGLVATTLFQNNRSMRIAVGTPVGDGPNAPIPTANHGEMVFQLFENRAPRVTDQIIALAESGFYDNVRFHRILNNFVIQGGDREDDENGQPVGTGGSPLGDFDDQLHVDLQHNRTGILSMAKTTDDTNDSQFFITEGPSRHLDSNHSIFGLLVEGEDVREAISNVPTDGAGEPDDAIGMMSVEIFVDQENGVLMLKAPEGASGQTDVTVTATDQDNNTVEQTFHVTVTPDTINSAPFLDEIPDIETSVNTPVTFQLTAFDTEGDAAFFLDQDSLAINGLTLPPSELSHVDLDYDVNFTTGLVTVTPKNGLTGTHFITVATARTTNAVDYQVVSVTIPEPSTVGLIAVGLLSLWPRRPRSA